MLSTFFSIRYIYIRWNGNFGLRARLLFPRPQRFPIPERNIFSLKKQDKRPTFEEYQPRRRSLFRIEWNVPFQFINSSNNSCINYLWTRGSFLPMNFHRGNWELCFSLPNYCWKIIIFLKLLEIDTLCIWYFSALKTFSRKNYHTIGMQIEAKVHHTFKTFARELCRGKVNKLPRITKFHIREIISFVGATIIFHLPLEQYFFYLQSK